MSQHVLYCFAHPDDETFTCGGTIARFSAEGVQQTLYCATRGEAGKTGQPPLCTQEELGDVRTQELARALDVLGMNECILRDYGDGRLAKLPFHQLVDDLSKIMEQIRPDLVITFPPSGISGHRDHQIIQQATLEAVKKTLFPTKLYYIVIPESIAHLHPGKIHTTPDEYVSMTIDVTPYREKIAQALREHKTQHLSIDRVFPGVREGDLTRLRTHEHFQLVIQK
ncbi:PIG-L deacetylase family protein [Laceyella putida]|uniref:PIG-L deacetylase family protein n=1 Tax=Laceyella putida TaxID=110101 RepID=A0ABW2RN34_9BACL